MDIPEARWILWITLLVVFVLVAVYVAKMFRDMAIGGSGGNNATMLSDFEQLRNEGKLDDDEYQKLKTTIREQTISDSTTGSETKPESENQEVAPPIEEPPAETDKE